MSRILVTGADGYIGSHVVKTAAEHGHQVFALDKSVTGHFQDVRNYCNKFFIRDFNWIDPVPSSYTFDAVVHLGALIDVHESTKIPSKYYQTNIEGTRNIMGHFRADHFIFASTGAAFDPVSPYARSKIAFTRASATDWTCTYSRTHVPSGVSKSRPLIVR
jgi:UDP-glucose 4-epimerase